MSRSRRAIRALPRTMLVHMGVPSTAVITSGETA